LWKNKLKKIWRIEIFFISLSNVKLKPSIMKQLGYYAKDKDNNLHQFEWGANDEFYIKNSDGEMVHSNPKEYEILEIGYFTADTPRSVGLTKEQLERRLVIMKQVATQLNDDLAKIGWADEDGFVNTCSVEDAGQDGNIGANLVNLFMIADTSNNHVENHCYTDAEIEALKPKAKERKWEQINDGVELNEDFLPNSDLTYTVEFDGIDRFRCKLEQMNFDRKMVGVEDAPKTIYYKLDKAVEDFNDEEKQQILSYRGLTLEDGFGVDDIFIEKSNITFDGVDVKINTDVTHRVMFEEGESAEDFKSRSADIFLHSSGNNGYQDREDLGGNTKIEFI